MAYSDSGKTPKKYSERIPNDKSESDEIGSGNEDVQQGFKRMSPGTLTDKK